MTGKPRALSDQQVAYIRINISTDNLLDLCEQFDVSAPTIRNALLGVAPYDEVTIPPPLKKIPRQNRKLKKAKKVQKMRDAVTELHQKIQDNPQKLDELRNKLIERVKQWGVNRLIAAEFDISPAYVSRIHNGHYDEND